MGTPQNLNEMVKVAAIIGVGPGIGSSVAHRFAKEGFSVALLSRSKEKLTRIQEEIEKSGGKAISIGADASDEKSIKNAFDEIRSSFGNPSVLVYNASVGIFPKSGILDITPERFESDWKVKIKVLS